MKHFRFKKWSQLNHQGSIMKKFRTKYEIISSSIRSQALEKGKDRIWSFFILATLRWLTPPPTQGLYNSCTLCDLEEKDNFDHIFRCNSLKSYHKTQIVCYKTFSLLGMLRGEAYHVTLVTIFNFSSPRKIRCVKDG